MKITRKQLRRLIAEAFKQKVPLFDPVTQGEIDALRQKGRQDADLSGLSASQIAKLTTLDQASPTQGRSLYQAFGSTEPGTSPQSEQDFLDAQDDYLVGLQDYNIEQALEDVFINGNRDPELLKQLGFTRFGDEDPNYRQSKMKNYSYHYTAYESILNKPIDDLMYVESISFNMSRFFYSIKHFLDNDERLGSQTVMRLFKVYREKGIDTPNLAVSSKLGGNEMIFI